MHAYATTKQLKKKECTKNSQNINKEICVQVTFAVEIKAKKYIFVQNMTILSRWCGPFETLLGWKCAYVC